MTQRFHPVCRVVRTNPNNRAAYSSKLLAAPKPDCWRFRQCVAPASPAGTGAVASEYEQRVVARARYPFASRAGHPAGGGGPHAPDAQYFGATHPSPAKFLWLRRTAKVWTRCAHRKKIGLASRAALAGRTARVLMATQTSGPLAPVPSHAGHARGAGFSQHPHSASKCAARLSRKALVPSARSRVAPRS